MPVQIQASTTDSGSSEEERESCHTRSNTGFYNWLWQKCRLVFKLSYPFKYRLLQPVDEALSSVSKLSYPFKYRLLQLIIAHQ